MNSSMFQNPAGRMEVVGKIMKTHLPRSVSEVESMRNKEREQHKASYLYELDRKTYPGAFNA